MSCEGQADDRSWLKGHGAAAGAIQEDGRQPTHVRLVAHAEEAYLGWVFLQQVKHCTDRAVCPQHRGLFDVSRKC